METIKKEFKTKSIAYDIPNVRDINQNITSDLSKSLGRNYLLTLKMKMRFCNGCDHAFTENLAVQNYNKTLEMKMTKWILRRVTNKKLSSVSCNYKGKLLSIGSVMHYAENDDYIWGFEELMVRLKPTQTHTYQIK